MIFELTGINGTCTKVFFQTMFLDFEVIEHLPILLVLINFSLEVTLEPIESSSENWMKIKKIQQILKEQGKHL